MKPKVEVEMVLSSRAVCELEQQKTLMRQVFEHFMVLRVYIGYIRILYGFVLLCVYQVRNDINSMKEELNIVFWLMEARSYGK